MSDASSKRTLYEILGVKPEATPEEIQAAWAALASEGETQPDPTQWLALKEAYGTLSNPRRRAVYDASLRQRELPAVAVQVDDDEEEPASHRNKLLIGGVAVVLLIAGWWLMRKPSAPKPAAPVVVVEASAAPQVAAAPAAPPPETQLQGNAWRCQGPLTGRGLELSFAPDGTYAGQSDGEPVRGDYTLSANKLVFRDTEQSNSFVVEELGAQRLVINRGEGKRLSCNR